MSSSDAQLIESYFCRKSKNTKLKSFYPLFHSVCPRLLFTKVGEWEVVRGWWLVASEW